MNVLNDQDIHSLLMAQASSLLKKFLKIIAWIALSIVLLLISVAVLIQVPAVQQKLISFATSYVSGKTHTRVEIKKISLSLPKSLSLEGIYLDDLQKDTLLYAGSASVSFSLMGLFHHKIHLSDITLDNVTANLGRKQADTLFNYNFLLTAFSDTTKLEKKDTSKSGWALQIDDINLNHIALRYNDEYGGSSVNLFLGKLKLKMDKIDTDQQLFDVDDLLVENLVANILVSRSSAKADKKSKSPPPVITAKRIRINSSNVTFADSINKQCVTSAIGKFALKKVVTDLNTEKISLDKIELSGSSIAYIKTGTNEADSSMTTAKTKSKNNWIVSVADIDMKDNKMAYSGDAPPQAKNTFDANHMSYSKLTLKANDLLYSGEETKVQVKKFSAVDANNFSINEFETTFAMDAHSMEAKKLKIRTGASSVDSDIRLSYSALSSLKDSIQFLKINAQLKNVKIKTSDILYFSPQLGKQAFFQNTRNITSVSGTVTGAVNNLTGKNMVITTGDNTVIKTNFIVAGLPYAETAYFNFPDLKVNSGRKDIEMIAGKNVIPESISLPNTISLLVNFKGKIKSFTSTVGIGSDYGSAHLFAIIDEKENFTGNVEISGFDFGLLLKNREMFGPVTLVAKTQGKGLNKNTIRASIKAESPEFFLNKYNYKDLKINGAVSGQKFEGTIALNDINAAFNFDGLVNLTKGQEEYKFKFDLQGADLQKLHLTENDMRIGLMAVSDLKGSSPSTINGKAGITKIVIAHNEKKYILDSLLVASINEKGKSQLDVSSAIVGIKYNGTFSPFDMPKEIQKFLNNYFPVSDEPKDTAALQPQNFNFEVQLHNHPVLSEVFFPELKEFEPGLISGSFDSEKRELKLDAGLTKIIYGSIEVRNFTFNANSDAQALTYQLNCTNVSNSQVKLENILLQGKLANNAMTATLSSSDDNIKKLQIGTTLTKKAETYTLKFDPDLYIMNDKWNFAAGNYIAFNKSGSLIHDLTVSKTESSIAVASVHDRFNDDLDISIKKLHLEDISRIFEKDTSLVSGTADGQVQMIKVNNAYGLIADASITDLTIKNIAVGNLVLKAANPTTEKYDLDVKLKGPDNDVSITGYLKPKSTDNSINIDADIHSLSLKTVEVLSMGNITGASGTANGRFEARGKMTEPDITGALTFNDAVIRPAALNSNLSMKHETVELKKDGIYFNSFTILDSNQNAAVINGNVKMNHFKDFRFALNVSTTDFTLFNTSAKSNEVYYGRMVIDSKIKVNGTMDLPVVNAKVKVKKGSRFTFAVPPEKLTTDKGEGVVVFTDSASFNPIITRGDKKPVEKSELKGLDISAVIEVDREATLKLIIDPSSGDSLVVRGDAALSFALDPSGKMSLTGAYGLNEGSYLVSLESVLKRKFDIEPGGTITWNGDPLDASVSLNAIYSVRASPVDLVADQLSGLSETEQAGYKQRYPFLVYLKLRGDLLHPEISFEIQLPPEEKGILGGAVNAKLNMLNEDPSSLNKQVFALLVLGRFVQENPLQTETNAASSAARTTVGKFLSAQLNQLSSKFVPGVELNFDVQSYDDYEAGQSEGRTEVEVGIKKQLFDERLTVQVGGSVDVEGEKAKQNSASDITSDVSLEYKLSKDGRYRLKGFRHNQYEGALEGQLVETGAGILYVKDFDKWREFLRPNRKKKQTTEKKVPDETKAEK